jgi:hypothetical protein
MRTSFTSLTLALVLVCGTASATTVTINPNQDNTICQPNGGELSNALGDIYVGRTNQTDSISRRRGLVSFDVAGNVPSGATITSVQFQLYLNRTADASSRTISIYSVTDSWGEGTSFYNGGLCASSTTGDASWDYRSYSTTSWTSAGGDYTGTASASISVGTTYQYYTWGSTSTMVSDVQGWLNSSSSNYGYIVVGDESTAMNARRFNSREESSNKPQLVVTYTTGGAAPRFFWAQVGTADVAGSPLPDTVWRNLQTNELLLSIDDGEDFVRYGDLSPSSVTHGVHDLGAGPALIVHDTETQEVSAVLLGEEHASPEVLVDGDAGLTLVRFGDVDADGVEELVLRDDSTGELQAAGLTAGGTMVIEGTLVPEGSDPDGI